MAGGGEGRGGEGSYGIQSQLTNNCFTISSSVMLISWQCSLSGGRWVLLHLLKYHLHSWVSQDLLQRPPQSRQPPSQPRPAHATHLYLGVLHGYLPPCLRVIVHHALLQAFLGLLRGGDSGWLAGQGQVSTSSHSHCSLGPAPELCCRPQMPGRCPSWPGGAGPSSGRPSLQETHRLGHEAQITCTPSQFLGHDITACHTGLFSDEVYQQLIREQA